MVFRPTPLAALLPHLCHIPAAIADIKSGENIRRVAVIGGGVGGTFAARYLAEQDGSCWLSAVDLFDPSPQLSSDGKGSPPNPSGGDLSGTDWQGPRVSSLRLKDGSIVELGASIIFGGNRLVTEQVEWDQSLEKADPGSTGKEATSDPGGFGIYDGGGVWDLLVRDDEPNWKVALRLAWRYGPDLVRIRRAVKQAFTSFEKLYDILDGPTVFSSPDDLWNDVGLLESTTVSFNEYLDSIGVSGASEREKSLAVEWSWWRVALAEFFPAWDGLARLLLPDHGNLRRELLDAININNYNQANNELDGLAGLVSFIPTQGEVYCIRNGNGQLLSSSFWRAKEVHATNCQARGDGDDGQQKIEGESESAIQHVQAAVTSVIYSKEGIEIWGHLGGDGVDHTAGDGQTKLGVYGTVILAAPLQQCRVHFQTRGDDNMILPLRLDGLISAAEGFHNLNDPPSRTNRTYTQTVTTVVGNATLTHESFGLSDDETIPRAISITAKGKGEEEFSALSRLSGIDGTDGLFKIFSSEPLTKDQLVRWFGPHFVIQYQKVWGGPYGGAYPNFAGGGSAMRSVPFLLHGSGTDASAAIFYVNAMEASVSAMEVSAIGAKAVAKLVAQKLRIV